jgi:hypothetical protein
MLLRFVIPLVLGILTFAGMLSAEEELDELLELDLGALMEMQVITPARLPYPGGDA